MKNPNPEFYERTNESPVDLSGREGYDKPTTIKLPLAQGLLGECEDGVIRVYDGSPEGLHIADIYSHFTGDDKEVEAFAQKLVTSVNNHTALVEALVQARNVLYADDPATAKAIAMIDIALAGVEKQPSEEGSRSEFRAPADGPSNLCSVCENLIENPEDHEEGCYGFVESELKTQNEIDASCWGSSIGRVRFHNDEGIGDAKGTHLRGAERKAFESGLVKGYENAAKGKGLVKNGDR